jgi:hypothetical protein
MQYNKKFQKIKKNLIKIIKQFKKDFSKKKIKFLKFIKKEQRIIDWHKVSFYSIIAIIFVLFFGFWKYNLGSAKGFIKIFPQVAQGNFQNLNEILTLDNIETSNINSFNQGNSTFPLETMKENMYSFEVNIKSEDLTIVLPNTSQSPTVEITTTTTLGSTEIIPTTTTLPIDTPTVDSDISTPTTTVPESIPTTTVPETTTTTVPEAPTPEPILPTSLKNSKPLLNFVNNNFKNISLLGLVSDLITNAIEATEEKNLNPSSKEVILSGFVLPELLEDEILTQFNGVKNDHEILNVKLGFSLANKHFDKNTDANMSVEVFNHNSWIKIETLELKEDISNGLIGSYYYIGLGVINSVQDIEELKVRIIYSSSDSSDKDRIYIDSSWIEVAINSDLEAIINDNTSEVENKLFTKNEDFYDFDQEVIITIPKEQSKIKKIYKEVITVDNNIVEINKNQTIVMDPTTTTTIDGQGSNTVSSPTENISPDTTTTIANNTEVIATTPQPEPTSPVEPVAPSPEPTPAPEPAPAPASSEPTTWFKKALNILSFIPKRIIASVVDLVEETVSPETITAPEVTTTIPLETTTTLSPEPEAVETTTTTLNIPSETSTTISNLLDNNTASSPATNPLQEDESLILREDLVAMKKFKIRSAILLTPDRRAFRNNITIDENESEYIVTIKQGPTLIPGKYQLMIKYKDENEFYRHFVDFTWGGDIIRDIVLQDGNRCFFVKDKDNNQAIYVQIKSSETHSYNLKIRDLEVANNSPIGFLENTLFFLSQENNLQGFDTVANSLFSQTMDYTQDNYFNTKDKKYLISIQNEIISFILQTN